MFGHKSYYIHNYLMINVFYLYSILGKSTFIKMYFEGDGGKIVLDSVWYTFLVGIVAFKYS